MRADTGEIRVSRHLGVFSCRADLNPKTARSQFIGGMTMGVGWPCTSTASSMDPRFGMIVNHDLASYHIATNADVEDIDAIWLDEDDPHADSDGARRVSARSGSSGPRGDRQCRHHATGVRVRDLPLTPDKFLA